MLGYAAIDFPVQFPPRALLAGVVGLTLLIGVIDMRRRARRGRHLRKLAARWEMHYSRYDRLHLAERIARCPTLRDVGDLRVTDVIYGRRGDVHRYVFRLELTREGKRLVSVARLSEPRGIDESALADCLTLAAAEGPLLEQYEQFAPSIPALQAEHVPISSE